MVSLRVSFEGRHYTVYRVVDRHARVRPPRKYTPEMWSKAEALRLTLRLKLNRPHTEQVIMLVADDLPKHFNVKPAGLVRMLPDLHSVKLAQRRDFEGLQQKLDAGDFTELGHPTQAPLPNEVAPQPREEDAGADAAPDSPIFISGDSLSPEPAASTFDQPHFDGELVIDDTVAQQQQQTSPRLFVDEENCGSPSTPKPQPGLEDPPTPTHYDLLSV